MAFNYLNDVQDVLTRYGMSIYVAFGNLGNILTIGIFLQREQRVNSCSIYLLTMTIFNLICLDVGIIPIIFSLDHVDISNQILAACKIQFYVRHTGFQIMRTCKVLTCIDRYALSSESVRVRNFSNRKMASRLTILNITFWSGLVLFFGIVRTIENNSCNIHHPIYAMIYTIYYMIFAGLMPPILIMIFSLLMMNNLRRIRSRIHVNPESNNENPRKRTILNKRDRDLMRMILIEVLIYIITTLPFSVFLVYRIVTTNYSKSPDRKQVEQFINYLAQSFMLYTSTALPFYVFILTSASFRRQCKRLVIEVYATLMRKTIRREHMDQTMSTLG